MPIPVSGRVFCSQDRMPETNFFWGVAFEGINIIFQQFGLDERNAATGEEFRPEEGSYILGEGQDSCFTLRTDPFGNCKLYMYRNGSDWIISDSYYNLLSHAKMRGYELTPNIGHVEAQRIGGMMGDQFISFKTAFEEVELVPQWNLLKITKNGDLIVDQTVEFYSGNGEYQTSLLEFLTKSMSRMKTWIGFERFTVSSDITGGIDSRVPLAMVAHLGLQNQVSVLSKPGHSEQITLDREISAEIVDMIGFEHRHAYPNFPQTLTFEVWRERCLGVYPVFFVRSDYPLSQQRLTGKAGELYRNQYQKFWREEASETFDTFRSKFHTQEGFEKARREFLITCEMIQNAYHDGVGIANAHYRSFRNRYHFAQDFSLEFYSSREFQNAFDRLCPIANEHFFAVYHDMLRLLFPEMLEIRFDNTEKDFLSHWHHFDVNSKLTRETESGHVFVGEHPEFLFLNKIEKKGRNRAVHLCQDILAQVQKARQNNKVVNFLLKHGVEPTWEGVQVAEDLFSFGRKFKSIDLLLLYDEFLSAVE